MTVEEVIAQVRRRVYDQVTVTADPGEGSEVALGLAGSAESGFVVRYGRVASAAAMTASTVTSSEHDATGNDNVSSNGGSSSGGSNSDGVVIDSSDVSTWTDSQQDYTELVYLCKYATTTQPPPPALTSSSDITNSGGGSTAGDSGNGVGGGLLSSSSSVHVPQLALLVMNEPNPETAGVSD